MTIFKILKYMTIKFIKFDLWTSKHIEQGPSVDMVGRMKYNDIGETITVHMGDTVFTHA
jgi:hypothetical protein